MFVLTGLFYITTMPYYFSHWPTIMPKLYEVFVVTENLNNVSTFTLLSISLITWPSTQGKQLLLLLVSVSEYASLSLTWSIALEIAFFATIIG